MLIPVRVDIVSDDRSLRIVDTIILDPTCWPITLTDPTDESLIEKNITHLAYTVITDAEVQSMGRTVRHFTNRQELWTPRLQQLAEQQLRPQLFKIATAVRNGNLNGLMKGNKDNENSNLIPISIRLILNRIVIHEDILWDPYGPITPVEFAEEMTKEYNLPDEATVSIVTTLLEQLYGLPMDESPDQTIENNITTEPRGAWMLDSKEKLSNDSQIAAQHRSI
jgi:hypothetical protein